MYPKIPLCVLVKIVLCFDSLIFKNKKNNKIIIIIIIIIIIKIGILILKIGIRNWS